MHDRVIAIQGTSNLRDIGGYPTRDGGRARRGMVYRSEALVFEGALTRASIFQEDNAHAYKSIAVRTIVDLRGRKEAEASPSAWPRATGAELIAFPMDAGGEGDAALIMRLLLDGKLRAFSALDLARLYDAMARELAPMFGRAIGALAEAGRLPALIHCAAGKDRTGLLVAFLQEILGVAREDVVADYALTGVLRPNRVGQYQDVLEKAGVEPEAVRSLFEAPAETMRSTLEGIDDEFGGVEAYLVAAGGMEPETIKRLRELLVEI